MKLEAWALTSTYINPRLSNSREKESERPGRGLGQHSRGLIQDREQILGPPSHLQAVCKNINTGSSEIAWADTVSYPRGDSELQHLGGRGTLRVSPSGMTVGSEGFGSRWSWVQVCLLDSEEGQLPAPRSCSSLLLCGTGSSYSPPGISRCWYRT